MRILLDIDGVVADLSQALCNRLSTKHGLFIPAHFTSPEFKDQEFSPGVAETLERAMCEPGFVQGLDTYPHVRESVKELMKRGHEVVFVTKPYAQSPTWVYDRQQWLERHFGDIPVVHTAHKELVRGHVLIEDNTRNLCTWLTSSLEGVGFLVDRPWNQEDKRKTWPKHHRVKDLQEVLLFL